MTKTLTKIKVGDKVVAVCNGQFSCCTGVVKRFTASAGCGDGCWVEFEESEWPAGSNRPFDKPGDPRRNEMFFMMDEVEKM